LLERGFVFTVTPVTPGADATDVTDATGHDLRFSSAPFDATTAPSCVKGLPWSAPVASVTSLM
jgi:hypothetical protein